MSVRRGEGVQPASLPGIGEGQDSRHQPVQVPILERSCFLLGKPGEVSSAPPDSRTGHTYLPSPSIRVKYPGAWRRETVEKETSATGLRLPASVPINGFPSVSEDRQWGQSACWASPKPQAWGRLQATPLLGNRAFIPGLRLVPRWWPRPSPPWPPRTSGQQQVPPTPHREPPSLPCSFSRPPRAPTGWLWEPGGGPASRQLLPSQPLTWWIRTRLCISAPLRDGSFCSPAQVAVEQELRESMGRRPSDKQGLRPPGSNQGPCQCRSGSCRGTGALPSHLQTRPPRVPLSLSPHVQTCSPTSGPWF